MSDLDGQLRWPRRKRAAPGPARIQLFPPRRRPRVPIYSTCDRGVDSVGWPAFRYLGVTALDRGKEPKGRKADPKDSSPNTGEQ